MTIDFYNIENLIFLDDKLRNILFYYSYIFEDYVKYKTFGNLNKIKKLKIDLLNLLNEKDIINLTNYFGQSIFVKKINNNIIHNAESSIDNCLIFNQVQSYKDFCFYRNKEKIFLTAWR